jgi:membrane protein DedA with SNARE-associated domain
MVFGFLHLHFHHRFHGPPVDYVGLALGAALSGTGIPGPGDSLLIAAGILAASGRLDITEVILVAFAAGTAGGVIGWLAGLKAGRALWSAPGPLLRWRMRALRRGERIFERHPVVAVVLTPAWIAGIHGVRSGIYQPLNAVSAALWAVGVGLGAYLVGPPVVDAVGDLGLATTIALGVFLVLVIAGGAFRRRRLNTRSAADG